MSRKTRVSRHAKIRRRVIGTNDRPRLCVFRSNQHIFAQIVDDSKSVTLVSAADFKVTGTKVEKAYNVGKEIAQKALKLKITTVVFDRGGFLYQGRVAELAKGAREGGLKF
jgi:large subunit ribosomal protein L18